MTKMFFFQIFLFLLVQAKTLKDSFYKISYTITNNHESSISLKKRGTPFGVIAYNFLAVYLNGKEIPYEGPLSIFAPNEEDPTINLDPGQSLTKHIEIGRYYDLSAYGTYTIRMKPVDNHLLDGEFMTLEGQIAPVTALEGKRGGLCLWNILEFEKKRRLYAKLGFSNTIILKKDEGKEDLEFIYQL